MMQSDAADSPKYAGMGNTLAVRRPRSCDDFHKVFDGKDDERVVERMGYMLKWTGVSTLAIVLGDIALENRKGALAITQRSLYWGIPIIGAGVTYVVALAAAASIRKKDGLANHYIAGAASGAIIGACKRSFLFGVFTGIGIGIIGATYKLGKQEGFYPAGHPDKWPPAREIGYPTSYKHDCTLIKSFPRAWVREAPREDCN